MREERQTDRHTKTHTHTDTQRQRGGVKGRQSKREHIHEDIWKETGQRPTPRKDQRARGDVGQEQSAESHVVFQPVH